MIRIVIACLALLGLVSEATAQSVGFQGRPGDVFDIRGDVTTQGSGSDNSSSSSTSGLAMTERVIAVGPNGVELEFDLPSDTSAEARSTQWQYPARLLRSADQTVRLLNTAELEVRLTAWLELGQFPREACGHWIFTWNAFKIECDPQSVIADIDALDLAAEAGQTSPSELPFVTEEAVDPESVRRERIEADAVVLDMMGDNSPEGWPEYDRQNEKISGVVRTTVSFDSNTSALSRERITALRIERPDGVVEDQTTTQTIERRLRAPAPAN